MKGNEFCCLSPMTFLAVVGALLIIGPGPTSAQCTWGTAASVQVPAVVSLRGYRTRLKVPSGVAVDSSGNLYTTDSAAGRVTVRNVYGAVFLVKEGLSRPAAIALDAVGNVLVAEQGTGSVKVFDSGLNELRSLGQGPGEFLLPTGVVVDPDPAFDRIYVSDGDANVVKAYSGAGQFLYSFGTGGTSAGQFSFPSAIFASTAGELFVGDENNDRVQIFDRNGVFKRCFGRAGRIAFSRNFGRIAAITADAYGRLYVADAFQGHVKVFDMQGRGPAGSLGSFAATQGRLRTPVGLALDPFGRMLVASANTGSVEVFGLDTFSDPQCASNADCPPDGDPCTMEVCVAGACALQPGLVESAACGTCNDCMDNDGNGAADAEDAACANLAAALPFAVVGMAPGRTLAKLAMSARVSATGGTGACGPAAPYPGGLSGAGLCADDLRIRGAVRVAGDVVVPSGAAVFPRAATVPVINGRYVASGTPQLPRSPLRSPLVGPAEVCDDGVTACSTDSDCSAVGGRCVPSRHLSDPANPFVDVSGQAPEMLACAAARQAIDATVVAVTSLAATDTTMQDLVVRARPRTRTCLADRSRRCATATITVGAGLQVLVLNSVRVASHGQVILAGQSDTVLVVRVGSRLRLGRDARVVTASGLDPSRVFWIVEGPRPRADLRSGAVLEGTVAVPAGVVNLGRASVLRGSVFAPIVRLGQYARVEHVPFIGGLGP